MNYILGIPTSSPSVKNITALIILLYLEGHLRTFGSTSFVNLKTEIYKYSTTHLQTAPLVYCKVAVMKMFSVQWIFITFFQMNKIDELGDFNRHINCNHQSPKTEIFK